MGRKGRFTRVLAVGMCGLGIGTSPAGAATFTVDTTDDCSLRGAFGLANSTVGSDIIGFDVPGGGTKTFTLGSALPNLTGPTEIRGYTQPGSSVNTGGWFADAFSSSGAGSNAVLRVEIDLNDNAGSSPRGGIVLSGSESSISG